MIVIVPVVGVTLDQAADLSSTQLDRIETKATTDAVFDSSTVDDTNFPCVEVMHIDFLQKKRKDFI